MDFVQPPPPPTTSYKPFKIIIILLILGFFIYEFRNGIQMLISIGQFVREFIRMSFQSKDSSPVNTPSKKPTPVTSSNTVKDTIDKLTPKPKYKPIPQPDSTTSNIQKNNKHCYIGEWKGVRSCYEINDESECTSKQLYPTAEHCQHPELR